MKALCGIAHRRIVRILLNADACDLALQRRKAFVLIFGHFGDGLGILGDFACERWQRSPALEHVRKLICDFITLHFGLQKGVARVVALQ